MSKGQCNLLILSSQWCRVHAVSSMIQTFCFGNISARSHISVIKLLCVLHVPISFCSVSLITILVSIPPHVTVVACKDPGHSAKSAGGRLQLNTHAPYVCGSAWSDMVHGCMVYAERAKMAAASCGTSHASAVSTPLWWIKKMHCKKLFTHVESCASVVSLLESGE